MEWEEVLATLSAFVENGPSTVQVRQSNEKWPLIQISGQLCVTSQVGDGVRTANVVVTRDGGLIGVMVIQERQFEGLTRQSPTQIRIQHAGLEVRIYARPDDEMLASRRGASSG